tara:strand:+ start:115320 stop:116399 length:1080 start_codon:yes stop_codon:yes gene_type:complete
MNNTLCTLAAIDFDQWFGHEWRFAQPQWLWLALAGPALALLILILGFLSKRKTRRIADSAMLGSIVGRSRRWNTWAHAALVMLAVCSMAVAVAQPESDPREVELESRGRDVVFLVDVSRSMLARDVAPSRLEKSKLWINDLVDELGSDRVGLVAFAGSSSVLSPLTTDRMFFQLALEELSPETVTLGGTNIGDAIRKTMEMVYVEDQVDTQQSYRDLVLISDGEDQESLPLEAARLAGQQGVRIIAIGIGSTKGAAVPANPDSNDSNAGRPVQSKLESATLQGIAAASPGGVYLEVGTGTIDLAQVYQELIASADQRTIDTSSQVEYTQRFMYFIAGALILIMIDTLLVPSSTRKALAC